ncbi:MAG: ACP S-malonyltransferase [Bacillota bacterium]
MLGFVFPGQGAQYVGMGEDLYRTRPVARRVFEEASDTLGYDMARLCFEGPAGELRRTERTQPALLTASVAALRVLEECGISPRVVAGLSLGEYSALVAAEALGFRDAVALVEKRGRYMQEAVPEGVGAMAAVLGLEAAEVEEICRRASARGVVEPANYNCPGQLVISGEVEAVRWCVDLAREAGAKRAVMLEVSAPFHCRLMRPAGVRLGVELEQLVLHEPRLPVVANVSAGLVRTPEQIRKALVAQVSSPVQWEQSVRCMVDEGCSRIVEVGPGKVLSGFVRRIAPEVETLQVEDNSSLNKLLDLVQEVC